ncbi:MAG: 6,7-dimethyl-8-ribityllumazine synthase, partial [Acidimicrobiia bacterium]
MQAALETGLPIVFGVLTTDDEDQAAERADPARLDKGGDAASTALEMVDLMRQLPKPLAPAALPTGAGGAGACDADRRSGDSSRT